MTTLLEALQDRILVYDGAMGTCIQGYELTAADYGGGRLEGCNEHLVLTRPDVISDIHEAYLAAGADVLETDTFGGSRPKLAEYGLEADLYAHNFAAAQLARQAADKFSTPERPRFVAGSIGPTGFLPSADDPTLSNITFGELVAIFEEQAKPLVEGGCDVLLVETSQDLLEVKAAIAGIDRYFRTSGRRIPLQVQVTLDTSGRMLLGTDIEAVIAVLEALPVDIIGLNCSTGPEHMREPVRILSDRSTRLLSVIPNAGLPLNVEGKAVYPLEPEPFADQLVDFVANFGVNFVGGCCGTSPDHIRALAAKLGGRGPSPRTIDRTPHVASAMRAVSLDQVPRPLIVGERLNAQGSRKVKQMLLADDYDGLVAIAREQMESGAHVLDLSVALNERDDEAAQIRHAVRKLQMGVEAPLMIDSTEASAIQSALEANPGRAIINSINLENGRARIEAVVPLAVEHGAAVVALTIDEEGMAKTAERKLAVARRIHGICAAEYGLPPQALIFDALTFTLATGQEEFVRSAIETMDGIRRIKAELPGVWTVLGVSNVSFGLAPAARKVLNAVFLHHCVEAGLDLAIVNASHVTPYAEIPAEERDLAEDLVLAKRPDALQRFIAHFEANAAVVDPKAEAVDPTAGMDPEPALHWCILHRRKEGVEALIDAAVERQDAVKVLNDVLLPAMKEVGDKFGAGELILPFVLQSAEVMKRAVARLETYLEKQEGYTKGKVVLATVYGDVHDIGKSLVNTILTNNGYTVFDLGKQVPINTIIAKAQEVGADAIGLSALLVSTSKQMPLCVQELAKRHLDFPVIIGGAAINRSYGRRIVWLDDGRTLPYEAGVYYAKDAFEGLEIMDQLTDPARREGFRGRILTEAKELVRPVAAAATAPAGVRSSTPPAERIPSPPFWGPRAVSGIDPHEVFPLLDLKTLFRLHWGARGATGEAWEKLLKEEFLPRLDRLKRQVVAEGLLDLRYVYGYFPCHLDGDALVVLDPADRDQVRARFAFPRQPTGEHLSLADYFRADATPASPDVVAFQVVTAGGKLAEHFEASQAKGDYAEGYYLHGLGVEMAEALAEHAHRRIRTELSLAPDQGQRYSWGYPAIPDLDDHHQLPKLLPLEAATGVTITEAGQLVPEASTAALVLHHPAAKYFSVTPGPAVAVQA